MYLLLNALHLQTDDLLAQSERDRCHLLAALLKRLYADFYSFDKSVVVSILNAALSDLTLVNAYQEYFYSISAPLLSDFICRVLQNLFLYLEDKQTVSNF